jgi:hypothetical protein
VFPHLFLFFFLFIFIPIGLPSPFITPPEIDGGMGE